MENEKTKFTRARALRYKKGALDSIGWDKMRLELMEITEACADVRWYIDDDKENLIAAMDGDEDEVFEFKMAFAQLEGQCDELSRMMENQWDLAEYYDDCTVSLIGNRYSMVGFDFMEEDYFSLCNYEKNLAITESGKRVCRWTKADMLAKIGQCMGVAFAFLDLRQQYDYLSATMDILREENVSILQIVKSIEDGYERVAEGSGYDYDFDAFLRSLPDRYWIE